MAMCVPECQDGLRWLPAWMAGEAIGGMRDGAVVLAGVGPAGVAIGAAIAAGPVDSWLALLSTPLLYGASAQTAALSLLGSGAAMVSILVAVLIINSRSLVIGASVRDGFLGQPRWFRWFGPYLMVDPLAVLAAKRYEGGAARAQLRSYYLAAGLTVWVGWHLAVIAGVLAGPMLPPALHLELALPLLLVGLLGPALRSRPAIAAALAAGLVAAVANGLPWGSALLAGAAAGAVAGRYLESRKARR